MEQGGRSTAVFVDPTGRRHRRVVRGAWLLAALGAAYVGLVVVSLLLPPSVSRLSVPGLGPVLPGPAAAPLGAAEGEEDSPAVLLVRSPSPTPRAVRSAVPQVSVRPSLPTVATASAPATSTATPTSSTSAASPSPTAVPRQPSAAPTAPPGQQTEPPGQASRSPRPRPSPTRGPR